MKEKFYPFRASEDYLNFYFESRSEERTIPKAVQFEKIAADIYNLALGDLDSDGELDDKVVSNNGDMRKIMSTVAQIIITFFGRYRDKQVYIIGNSPSRMRLYRAILAREMERWSELFEVNGMLNGKAVPFEIFNNYEAFLIKLNNKIYETENEKGRYI